MVVPDFRNEMEGRGSGTPSGTLMRPVTVTSGPSCAAGAADAVIAWTRRTVPVTSTKNSAVAATPPVPVHLKPMLFLRTLFLVYGNKVPATNLERAIGRV